MDRVALRLSIKCVALGILAVGGAFTIPSTAHAKYHPDHPEVKALVAKGLAYLDGRKTDDIGRRALMGLAFLKGQSNRNHPKILDGVAAIQSTLKGGKFEIGEEGPVYTAGLGVIFLCELDAETYRTEIQTLLNYLYANQKGHGGWGYPHRDTGDTSMTQYGVLSMWTAKNKGGFDVPDRNVAGVCNWLLRTQDPSGGWGYQGKDPGNFNRVPQRPVTPSLTAAGNGSLYICADLLGLTQKAEPKEDDGLPPALQRVVDEPEQQRRASNLVDRGRLMNGIGGGNGWFAKNSELSHQVPWVYYYMYALERYRSFEQMATFGQIKKDAAWYDAGVEFLKKQSNPKGSWSAESGSEAGTSFAILFLVRSTGKSIAEAAKPLGGDLEGGRGLSGDLATARVGKGGQIETADNEGESIGESVEDILRGIDTDEISEEVALEIPRIKLPDDRSEREKQLEKLRAAVAADRFEARIIAVKTLVAERSLDNAPVLIYALTDPDLRVVMEARKGLRYISRKFNGLGMPDAPSKPEQWRYAEAWRDWYYGLRPEAEELEEIVLPDPNEEG